MNYTTDCLVWWSGGVLFAIVQGVGKKFVQEKLRHVKTHKGTVFSLDRVGTYFSEKITTRDLAALVVYLQDGLCLHDQLQYLHDQLLILPRRRGRYVVMLYPSSTEG